MRRRRGLRRAIESQLDGTGSTWFGHKLRVMLRPAVRSAPRSSGESGPSVRPVRFPGRRTGSQRARRRARIHPSIRCSPVSPLARSPLVRRLVGRGRRRRTSADHQGAGGEGARFSHYRTFSGEQARHGMLAFLFSCAVISLIGFINVHPMPTGAILLWVGPSADPCGRSTEWASGPLGALIPDDPGTSRPGVFCLGRSLGVDRLEQDRAGGRQGNLRPLAPSVHSRRGRVTPTNSSTNGQRLALSGSSATILGGSHSRSR